MIIMCNACSAEGSENWRRIVTACNTGRPCFTRRTWSESTESRVAPTSPSSVVWEEMVHLHFRRWLWQKPFSFLFVLLSVKYSPWYSFKSSIKNFHRWFITKYKLRIHESLWKVEWLVATWTQTLYGPHFVQFWLSHLGHSQTPEPAVSLFLFAHLFLHLLLFWGVWRQNHTKYELERIRNSKCWIKSNDWGIMSNCLEQRGPRPKGTPVISLAL